MIGRLRGSLAEKQPPHLVLDVNGVGYEVEVPMTTLYRLPHVGETVTLHTHLVVREDAHLLYGFYEKRDSIRTHKEIADFLMEKIGELGEKDKAWIEQGKKHE